MLSPFQIKPGFYTLDTDRGARGRWKNGDHVRFYRGLPQKIGGWQRANSNMVFEGKVRNMIDWQSLDLDRWRSIGTELKLYVWKGGVFSDITPLRASGTLGTDPFTTASGLPTVTVEDTAHGENVGDYVHFSGASAVGGITISGTYLITSITDADHYVITHSANASSTATGGGAAVAYEYEIHVGSSRSLMGRGFGVGRFGKSTWGTARVVSNDLFSTRVWSLDKWGEDLIACPRGGAIYVWDTSVGVNTRATLISGSPATCKFALVAPDARHLVALGAHDGSSSDPLLIRWSSSEDYTDWTETETNTAGSHRVDHGNEILCGVKTDKEIVVFTDSALYSMVYQGNPYQFEIRHRGSNGGLVGPNAAKEFDGRVFWMGSKDFWMYDGAIKLLNCEVVDYVMNDINRNQAEKVHAFAVRQFGEVWWLYCSATATEIDRYVVYNAYENSWYYGTITRTAGMGDSETFATPYAAGVDGYFYNHEVSTDDDLAALNSYIESGDVDISEGEQLLQIRRIIPDFERLSGSVKLTLTGKKYPQATETVTKGPYVITATTEQIKPRIKARQVSLKIESTDIGDDWRMGVPRPDALPHGKR